MRTGRFLLPTNGDSSRRVFSIAGLALHVPLSFMRVLSVTPFLCVLASTHLLGADAGTDPRAVVAEWINAGAKVKSLEIDFVQERKLKALRMPLTKPGKIWFQRPESFRWQINEPPTIVAVRKSGGDLRVADTKEKTLRVWSAAELAAEAANGKGHGFAMAGAGFPASIEAFEQMFEIDSAKETPAPGVWDIRLDLRDKKAGIFVKEIVFTIQPGDGSLKKFDIFMRDGSIMTTRVLTAKKNTAIPAAVFQIDETGYQQSSR